MSARHSKLLMILLLWAGSQTSAAQEVYTLSVEDAVRLALQRNPDVDIAALQVSGAEYAAAESRGNFLPRLDLNGSYTRNIDKPVIFLPESFGGGGATEIGSDNNFNGSLDLSLPLYSRYNSANRDLAYGNLDLQREMLNGQQQNVAANVRKAYYALQVLQAAIGVRQKALDNAKANLTVTNERVSQGVATAFDQASAEVKVATARNSLLEAQSQIVPAVNQLRLLLGLPLGASIIVTDSLFLRTDELLIPQSTGDLLNNAVFRQELFRARVNSLQTEALRAAWFPVLSGVGSYQYQSQHNHFDFNRYDWVQTSALGLRLQAPLFNGTITRRRVQQSVVNERVAQVRVAYAMHSNEVKFNELVSKLGYIRQRIALQADNLTLTAKALELVKERYQYGRASLLEVNSAELDYVSARLSHLQAIADYKTAWCDLELLLGQ